MYLSQLILSVLPCVGLVEAIIDAAYDKDTEVRRTLCRSLVDIGSHCPELVLRSCHRYLSKRPKVNSQQTVS